MVAVRCQLEALGFSFSAPPIVSRFERPSAIFGARSAMPNRWPIAEIHESSRRSSRDRRSQANPNTAAPHRGRGAQFRVRVDVVRVPDESRGDSRQRCSALSSRGLFVDVPEDLGDHTRVEDAPSGHRAQLERRVSAVDRSGAEVRKKAMILILAPHLQVSGSTS